MMRIDWNIKETPTPKGSAMRRTAKWIKKFIFGTSVPLHNSNHYNRDHFI